MLGDMATVTFNFRVTRREIEAISAIRLLWGELGFAPSVREFAELMGYRHVANACRMLDQLEKKRLIKRIRGKYRTLQVTRLAIQILSEQHEYRRALQASTDEQVAYNARGRRRFSEMRG